MTTQRFAYTWRNKWITSECSSIVEMIAALRGVADQLEKMQESGVTLDVDASGMEDDYATLVTDDPKVAKKFGMEEEEIEE